jgi:O-succinylbenzoate synthase
VVLRGPAGWGEFAPFADYDADADARWVVSAVAAATAPPPSPRRSQVPVNAILPEVPAGEVAPFARAAVREQGCTTMKVKVGRPELTDDVAVVAAVREVLDSVLGAGGGRIRLDANGRWSAAEAVTALEHLRPFGLEYVEQPCRGLADLRRLRSCDVGVRIAVDETIRLDGAFADVADLADVAVLKVSPLGGPDAVLAIAGELAVPVVLSGSLESSVGLAQDVGVAAALPELPYACGFGTGSLLADDLCEDRLLPHGGTVPVRPAAPDGDALQRARARLAGEQQASWLSRLDAAWNRAQQLGLVPGSTMGGAP